MQYNHTFTIIIYEKKNNNILIIKCTLLLHVHTQSYAQVYPPVKSGISVKNATSVDFTGFELWSEPVHNFSYMFLLIFMNNMQTMMYNLVR